MANMCTLDSRAGILEKEGGWCDGPEHAASYAEFRPVPPTGVLEYIVDYVKKTRSPLKTQALDVGSGTGLGTRELAKYFDTVIGVDVSESQIEQAKRYPKNPSNVSYAVTEPENFHVLEDASCDLVTAFQAAHWFNIEQFYKEANRVLAPGGTLALVCYGLRSLVFPWCEDLTEKLTNCYIERIFNTTQAYWRDERRHVDNDYAEFDLTGFEDRVYIRKHEAPPSFTGTTVTTMAGFRGYLETWSGLRNFVAEKGPGTGDKMLQDLTEEFASIGGCSVDELEKKEIHLKEPHFLRLGRKPV